ncbi:MAG: alpha/beta hydrolase [Flavobacteriaceae bacterium]|nr:alpha/beta hydrolase [Flavobacteriaceae bacterium]
MPNKTHIYFMPGLAASAKIFEYIKLPEEKFEFHFLSWVIPESIDESLENYVKRIAENIEHKNPVLVGVSFGGIIVQELSQIIPTKQVVIISSIKNLNELPKRLKLLKITKAYKLFPSKKLSEIEDFSKFGFINSIKNKSDLYNKYLDIRNKKYLDWAIYNVLHWQPKNNNENIFHIHGSEDAIFPIKYIKNSIIVEGGTHAMIIVKAKKINNILEKIIV